LASAWTLKINKLCDYLLENFVDLFGSPDVLWALQVDGYRARDYDYHRVPAPWIQIKILQILGKLGHGDKSASDHAYEIINETLRR
jgi:hypothetical protein